jgi:hypothetical protein
MTVAKSDGHPEGLEHPITRERRLLLLRKEDSEEGCGRESRNQEAFQIASCVG